MEDLELRKEKCTKTLTNTFFKEINFNQQSEDELYNTSYKKIVSDLANLIRNDLKKSDSYSASIIYEYLLWYGYLSNNKYYGFSPEDRANNTDNYGADIMLGKGVCLNNACMLNDLLNKLNISSYFVACKISEEVTQKDLEYYKPNIEKNVINTERKSGKLLLRLFRKQLINMLGNHAVVIVEDKKDLFAVDPTNLLFLTFNDFLKAGVENADVNLEIKPFLSGIISGIDNDKLLETLLKTDEVKGKKVEALQYDNIKKMYEENIELCNNNIALLNDFHDYIKNDIDNVCKSLKKQ